MEFILAPGTQVGDCGPKGPPPPQLRLISAMLTAGQLRSGHYY